uniref:XRE family transcriptional regulator n=1 Tax=Streptomyces sp. NBC_00003 TaxID=2903608 RepID=A0AAU2VAM7_9ACTN
MVRGLCERALKKAFRSHRAIAKEVPIAASALSSYTQGRVVPSPEVIARLREIAVDCSGYDADDLPSLENLLEIRRAASVSKHGLGSDSVRTQLTRLQAARRRQMSTPVPTSPSSGAVPPTPAADDAIRHLRAGRESDAFSLFWHIGQTHTPTEIRDVVASYSIAREVEAADAVLASASEREAEDVLKITASLLEAQRHDDAAALVEAAVQRIS